MSGALFIISFCLRLFFIGCELFEMNESLPWCVSKRFPGSLPDKAKLGSRSSWTLAAKEAPGHVPLLHLPRNSPLCRPSAEASEGSRSPHVLSSAQHSSRGFSVPPPAWLAEAVPESRAPRSEAARSAVPETEPDTGNEAPPAGDGEQEP